MLRLCGCCKKPVVSTTRWEMLGESTSKQAWDREADRYCSCGSSRSLEDDLGMVGLMKRGLDAPVPSTDGVSTAGQLFR